MKYLHLLLLFLSLKQTAFCQSWAVPAGDAYTQINKNGTTILPNGRLLTPRGRSFATAPHPYGLVLSANGKVAITANSGINPFSISIIRNVFSQNPDIQQVPNAPKTDDGILEACFMGLAISPNNKIVYVAGGQTNKVFLFDVDTGQKLGHINCAIKTPNADYSHGYLGDMAMTTDGKTLYVLDQIGFRMVVIDLLSQKVVANVPTGRYPFGITLSPDESHVFVANVGVFEYKTFTDLNPKDLKNTAHTYPATKYGSKEMIEGDANKGILPLGDPNAPEAFSVWVYSVLEQKKGIPQFQSAIKTGFLVGLMIEDFPAVGGSSPNSLVATNQYVMVSNGNNDCVSVIDYHKKEVVKNIFLNPEPRLKNLRGLIPFGLALSPNQQRLYVAEAGINAVGVVDIPTLEVIGHIPTGWFPSKLKVSNDGQKLIVANAKGYGSGPNGGKNFKINKEGSYIGSLMKGTVSVMDIPSGEALKAETKAVIDNNYRWIEDKNVSKLPDSLKYIVFISKENRTYDEVFGQNKLGKGDPTLARFGLGRQVANRNRSKIIAKADVMPNHVALARRFGMADNFYCDSDVSADGHRWLVMTYPNEWVETSTAAFYGGKRDLQENSQAPGNLALIGAAGSIYPEDYNEAGSMWEHLQRHNIDFYNFGFGVEMAANYSDSTMKYIGELYTVNYPLPAPLYDKSSRTFPTYNMAIPDQFRADLFMKEFNEKWSENNLPPVLTLMLPNDHGTSERPHAGFGFQESYMADNDLALGRTIEFLSRTPYWKNMLVVVTEDDPQGGIDHIDAHRSILLLASPYLKKNYVGHQHYSFGSIFKTFWDILKIPYLNQYDATASNLADMFTTTPDFSPYNALKADVQIFDPAKALTPINEKFDWKAFAQSEEMDKTETMQKRRNDDDKAEKRKTTKKQKK